MILLNLPARGLQMKSARLKGGGLNLTYGNQPISFRLSTGQKLQSPEEILEFLGEVKGDIAQEVEAMTEEGLERPPECFFKGIG